MEVYVRISGRTAEEAFTAARALKGSAGIAIDVDMIAGIGPAVVSALDELGPVMVLAPLSGSSALVAVAAGRLARLGAAWIGVASLSGTAAVAAAVEAVAGTGCGIAAVTLPVGLEAAEVAALTGGSRGRLVSRLTVAAIGAGASGVVCSVSDLGVIAQVAPEAVGIVDAGEDPAEWEEAARRGAAVLVLPGLAALSAFTAGGRPAPSRSGDRGRRR